MNIFVIQAFDSCMGLLHFYFWAQGRAGGSGGSEDRRKLQSKTVKTGVFEEEEENAVFLTIITRVLLYKEKHDLYNDKVKFCNYYASTV